MAQLEVGLNAAQAALDTVSEMAPDFVRLHERVTLQLSTLHDFQEPCAEGSVRWVEVGSQMRLVESPLDISLAVQTHMIQRPEPTPATEALQEDAKPAQPHRAWVFTSATLGEDAHLWFE
jgi:ATP-dependent DNA helicase DinG